MYADEDQVPDQVGLGLRTEVLPVRQSRVERMKFSLIVTFVLDSILALNQNVNKDFHQEIGFCFDFEGKILVLVSLRQTNMFDAKHLLNFNIGYFLRCDVRLTQ